MRNYDLKATAARVAAAQAQVRIVGAARKPQLEFAARAERAHEPAVIEGEAATTLTILDLLFSLSWELDVWGRIRAAQTAAEEEALAAGADFNAARLSLVARTVQAWFDLIEARLQAQVAETSVRDRRTIAELVRGRFERGLTRGLDLRLTLTDLANAEAVLAQARNQQQLAQRRLEVLLGRYPAGRIDATTDLPELPPPVPAGLPTELLTRRPDLKAAFARLREADWRVASAQAALLPRFALTGSGGLRSGELGNILQVGAGAGVWSIAGNLLQPIFTGGLLLNEIRFNQALVEEAFNRYRDTALTAFREVEQPLAAEEWLRTQERALFEAVQQTEASRKLAVYSYQNGLIEILTLLDSYRSTLNAQSEYLVVRRQLLNNRIDLYLALGGGF